MVPYVGHYVIPYDYKLNERGRGEGEGECVMGNLHWAERYGRPEPLPCRVRLGACTQFGRGIGFHDRLVINRLLILWGSVFST